MFKTTYFALIAGILTMSQTLAGQAGADTRTLYFKGTNPTLANSTPLSDFELAALPSIVTGSFTYDTDTAPSGLSDAERDGTTDLVGVSYLNTGTVSAVLGGLTITEDPGVDITLTDRKNNLGNDIFTIVTSNLSKSFLLSPVARIGTISLAGTADDSVGSGFTPETIEQISGPGFSRQLQFSLFQTETGAQDFLWFNTVELSDTSFAAPIPLPASLPMLFAGLAGIAALMRRRKPT